MNRCAPFLLFCFPSNNEPLRMFSFCALFFFCSPPLIRTPWASPFLPALASGQEGRRCCATFGPIHPPFLPQAPLPICPVVPPLLEEPTGIPRVPAVTPWSGPSPVSGSESPSPFLWGAVPFYTAPSSECLIDVSGPHFPLHSFTILPKNTNAHIFPPRT